MPLAPLTLRSASLSDYDAIADIWHSSASLPTVGPPTIPSRDSLRERLDMEFVSGWVVTVAEREGEVVGFVAIRPEQAVLAELFVRPGLLGSGIGRPLLDVAKEAMPAGFTLFTRSANSRARRFYEAQGLVFLRDELHPRAGDAITYYRWPGV